MRITQRSIPTYNIVIVPDMDSLVRISICLVVLCARAYCAPQVLNQEPSPSDNQLPEGPASGTPGKSKTTLVVPRSNNIQIAFAGQGEDASTGLHVDLLRLYKEVMEEILQRNNLIHTVETLLSKMAILDGLEARVKALEDGSSRHDYSGSSNKGQGGSDGSVIDNNVSYESYLENYEENNKGDTYDWEVLFRELQSQQRSLRALHESRRKDERILEDSLDRMTQLSAEVDHLRLKQSEMHEEVSEYKRQVTDHAQVAEGHTNQLILLDSSVEVLEAKANKISLDVQWQGFKIGMLENTTDVLKRDVRELQDQGMSGDTTAIYDDSTSVDPAQDLSRSWSGDIQAGLDACKEDISTMLANIRQMRSDVNHLHTKVAANTSQKLEMFNASIWRAIGLPNGNNIQEFVEDTSTQLYNLLHRLNATQRQIQQQTTMQQVQMDQMSLDVENLKDEAAACSTKISDHIRQIQYLKDYNLHGRREREKLRRKFEKLQREVREMLYSGVVGQPMPGVDINELMRRTTRAAELVVTQRPGEDEEETEVVAVPEIPDGLAVVTQEPTEKSSMADMPGAEVGLVTLPVSVEEEVLPDRRVQETSNASEEGLDTNETTDMAVKKNCSISGFGNRRLIRTFKRILTGAWMRDPAANDGRIFMLRNNVKVTNIREYADEERLADNSVTRIHHLPFRCTGTGHVVYRGSLYCNKYETNRVIKYDLETERVSQARLRNAGFNNTFPYASGALTDIDFAVDEHGLWAIYSSETHHGNIVIGSLDPETLYVEREWVTHYLKTSASNAFMACGRLYVTQYHSDQPVEVTYIYDTTSGQETRVEPGRIIFDVNPPDIQTSLNYDPGDSRLYAWVISKDWDGLIVTYEVFFPMT